MAVPLGLMTGADVGIVEKKQGSVTFPESEPVTGLIIDNVLDAEMQNTEGLNAASVYIPLSITAFLFCSSSFFPFLYTNTCIHSDPSNCKKTL